MCSLVSAYILAINFYVHSFTKICEHIAASLEFGNSKGH